MYTLGHTCSLDLTTPLADQRPHAEATNRIDVSGPARPIVGLSLPPPLHGNLPGPSRTRASVHFDPVVDAGLISSAPREPATTRTVVPSHCTFVPKAYTNGATGQTYVRNDQAPHVGWRRLGIRAPRHSSSQIGAPEGLGLPPRAGAFPPHLVRMVKVVLLISTYLHFNTWRLPRRVSPCLPSPR